MYAKAANEFSRQKINCIIFPAHAKLTQRMITNLAKYAIIINVQHQVLEKIFHELNLEFFAQTLPLPKLKWNTRLSATAGRFAPGSKITNRPPIIEVAAYLNDIQDGLLHIRDTILHEMIHLWLWHRDRPYGHTEEFYAKMRETGAKRFNPVPKERPIRYHYSCLQCQTVIPSRRRMNDAACHSCCKRYNNGFYSRRFRLQLVVEPKQQNTSPLNVDNSDLEQISCTSTFDQVVARLSSLRDMVSKTTIRK